MIMCLGFIVPGVILGYGSAAVALLNGSSAVQALGILVASGFGVTLTGGLWYGLASGIGKAAPPPRAQARDKTPRTERHVTSAI